METTNIGLGLVVVKTAAAALGLSVRSLGWIARTAVSASFSSVPTLATGRTTFGHSPPTISSSPRPGSGRFEDMLGVRHTARRMFGLPPLRSRGIAFRRLQLALAGAAGEDSISGRAAARTLSDVYGSSLGNRRTASNGHPECASRSATKFALGCI